MKLAIITSHPIQYNAPWFRYLNAQSRKQEMEAKKVGDAATNGIPAFRFQLSALSLRVFYLWDGAGQLDTGFGHTVKWDIPLLEGYDYEFVPNSARQPGPGSMFGLRNPSLGRRIAAFAPDAVLLFGYNYLSHYRFLFSNLAKRVPLIFRGDSHLLRKTLKRRNVETLKYQSTETPKHRVSAFQLSSFSAFLKRLVFRRFAAFLYVGKANGEYFRHHGVPEERLFFAPHAVDNERFMRQAESARRDAIEWKKGLGIPAHHKVILFAGKFEPTKRPSDLIAAFLRSPLSALPSPLSLLMVGNGPLEPELRRQAAGAPNIFFAPFQNQTQMPRTYAAADVLVLPSESESWGLAVNEAMCLGLPIVVSDHVGCAQDLVHSGRNGLVFPAGDVEALTRALREAFSDPERLQRWGEASRAIIQDYSYEQTTKGLLAALNFCCARSESPPAAKAPEGWRSPKPGGLSAAFASAKRFGLR